MDDFPAWPSSRREILTALALGGAAAASSAKARAPIKAIAFDAFVLFNPGMIARRAAEIVGDEANGLIAAASAKLFAYTWLYTSASQYAGFEALARDAFSFAAQTTRVSLSDSELDHLVAGYSALDVWTDVPPALEELRRRGFRLVLLSNLPQSALGSSLRQNGIAHQFAHVLSTDRVKKFKPAPEAYAMAISSLRLRRDEIGFAAFAGWDAAGATWFGYRTAWINRSRALPEQAHARPAIVSDGMDGVLALTRM